MKKLAIALVSLGFSVSLSSYAQQTATWDLARDLQISFTQGANGVWFFMESEALVHDPAVYRLLTRYFALCGFEGVGCWRGIEDHPSVCPSCVERTEVGFNFTNKVVGFCDDFCWSAGYRPHKARLLPTTQRFAIVAWQSPVTGTVKVSARFTEKNPLAAQSAGWSVDKGNQILRSGGVGVGWTDGALASLSNLRVAKDDVLYFVVDNAGWIFGLDYTVDLQVTITQVQ